MKIEKLVLNRETVRDLTSDELVMIGGGGKDKPSEDEICIERVSTMLPKKCSVDCV